MKYLKGVGESPGTDMGFHEWEGGFEYRGIRLSLTPTDNEDDDSDLEVVGVQCADVVVISDDDNNNDNNCEQGDDEKHVENRLGCGDVAVKEESSTTEDVKKEEELDEDHSTECNDISTQSSVTEDTSTCSSPKQNQQPNKQPQRKPTTGILSLLRD